MGVKASHNKMKTRFWNDPDKRALLFQVIVAAVVAFMVIVIVDNTVTNLEKRGVTTGFDFLEQSAGFGITQTLIDFDESHSFGRTFIVGLLNTILVSILGIILSTVVGFLVGVGRLSGNWLVSRLCGTFIEIFRNIPVLLQIMFWYFAVLRILPSPRQSLSLGESIFLNVRGLYVPEPLFQSGAVWLAAALLLAIAASMLLVFWNNRRQRKTGQTFPVAIVSIVLLLGLPTLVMLFGQNIVVWESPQLKGFNFRGGITVLPELMALLLGLVFYTASYIAENVRSGIEAVNKGQTEAAHALGLSRGRTLRLVIIPQAMRVVIPPLSTHYMNLIKNSSLATAIGYPDMVSVFMGTTLNQTGQAIEIIGMTMAVYLMMSLLVSLLMNLYNRKMALVEK